MHPSAWVCHVYFRCFPGFSLVLLTLEVDWEGRSRVLVSNLRTMKMVYWVNVSESYGAGSPGLSQIKGHCCISLFDATNIESVTDIDVEY